MFEPAKAPFIRPGAVIHELHAPADSLLAGFAASLRKRGFNVGGCVTLGGTLIDLASGDGVPAEMDGARLAAWAFRNAMREDADLVVVGAFPHFTAAARELMAQVHGAPGDAMPALTAVPGADIGRWMDFAGPAGQILAPTPRALWQWWGPDRLYRDLSMGVAHDEIRRMVCGPRWLMIQGPAGVGLAYLPKSSKELQPRLAELRKMSLRQLAEFCASWDALEMAVGIAAINAHYNRVDLAGEIGNGAESFSDEAGRVVVVGAFPGLADTLANPQVVEVEPRPGEFPTIAMDSLLPGCAAAVVASSTIVNRTLPRILRLAQGARVAMVGPITPLSPRLHDYGLEILGGLVIRDADGLAEAIQSGAHPREFPRFGQYMHIRQPHPAASTVRRRA